MLEDLGRVIAQMNRPRGSDQSTMIVGSPPPVEPPSPKVIETSSGRPGGSSDVSPPNAVPGRPTETPPATPRFGSGLDAIARRRAAQIAQYLEEASRELEAGRFEAAIEHC